MEIHFQGLQRGHRGLTGFPKGEIRHLVLTPKFISSKCAFYVKHYTSRTHAESLIMKLIKHILWLSFWGVFSLSAHAGGDAASGKIIAGQTCQACHGADGNGTNPLYPRLAGQYTDYLERALAEYKSGDRSNPIMAGFAASLSKQDIKNVAAWFAGQTGLTSPVEPNTVHD